MDDFFSFVSKAVLIIPIFILITSLFIKFNQSEKRFDLTVGRQVNQAPTIIPVTKKNDFKFNLQGPIACDNLFIQNKKVFFKNRTTNYLLNGDCLYIWEKGKSNGEKKCSLSNYINLAENYMGFFSTDDLVNNSLVKEFIKDKNINLTDIIKSCRSVKVKDTLIFEIPKEVLFSDTK
jgi:hypothetical protein